MGLFAWRRWLSGVHSRRNLNVLTAKALPQNLGQPVPYQVPVQVFPLKLVSVAAQARITAPLRVAVGVLAVASPTIAQDVRTEKIDLGL